MGVEQKRIIGILNSIFIASLGVFINVMYFSFEYIENSNRFSLFQTWAQPLEYGLVLITMPLYMVVGTLYLHQKRSAWDLEIARDELYSLNRGLELRVAERTKELKQAYDELKSIDKVKDNIISNVSHELRTPIAIVRGVLEIIGDIETPEERDRYIQNGLNSLAKQNLIISDLLETVDLETSKTAKERENFELSIPVQNAIDEVKQIVKNKKITLNFTKSEEIPQISGDMEKVQHAIRNILSNALKFTSDEGIISINIEENEKFIKVIIEDNGIGIPKAEIDHIFDRFYQVDSSITRKYGGTGLGLAITKDIVNFHGGEIRAESEEGKGSAFYLSFPRIKEVD